MFLFNGYILFYALVISNTLIVLFCGFFFFEVFLWAFLEVFW